MDKGEIISVLEKWNFWKREIDTGKKRTITEKLFPVLKYDKVLTIVGVRRSGKSYILRQFVKTLIKKNIPKEDILIVNFEEPAFEGSNLKLLLKIYEGYKEIIKPKGKPYIFLDEIQEVKNWEKFVRSLNERKEAHLILTGSSSKLMSEELGSILTGRQLTFEVLPLSFKEFLMFNNLKIRSEKDIYLNMDYIKKYVWEYVKYGGFPEVVLIENKEIKNKIIFEYYNTIINRDIVGRYKIRSIEKMRSLARYYFSNISSLITYRKLSKFLKIPTETISRFSEYLQTAKLIFFIDRFSFSLKEQENSPRKIYCIDNGFFISLGFRFMENRGKLLENLVAIEFLRRKFYKYNNLEIYYWKDYKQREVDFVVKEGIKIKQLIQVCYSLEDGNTKEREVKSLVKASKELKCKDLFIITFDEESEIEQNNCLIKVVPLWKWLLFD